VSPERSPPSGSPVSRARRSAGKRAVVIDRRELRFDGPAPWPHVRAASAIVRYGHARLIVQDDALFLAELGGSLRPLALPAGADGLRFFSAAEGTKQLKPDLEAALALPDGRAVLFGSGSAPARERLFVLTGDRVEIVHAPELYLALRDALGPGVELNVEGVVLGPSRVRLLQRGNGRGAVDAELRIPLRWLVRRLDGAADPEPPVVQVKRWELGELGGARLSFTDGLAQDRGFVFLASAERSPDAIEDGEVTGSAIGFAGPRGGWWTPLVDAEGRVLPLKAEGLAAGDRPGEWLVTSDPDDVDRPSELLTVRLEDPVRN
jgi:hypothetical protein